MELKFWENWAGNEWARADSISPRTKADLCECVRKASQPREGVPRPRLRVAGGSYSWAPLIKNDDTILHTQHLDRVLSIDKQHLTCEVECGVTIEELNRVAAENGMTLITPTLFPKPTIGGVVATGCHGTSRLHGNFSDNVLEMTIIDAEGNPATIDRDHKDFEAAQVALGTLGVLYSVKLQLQTAFNVRVETRKVPVHEVLAGLDDLRETNDSVEIFWWPFRDTMYVYTMNRTKSWPDKKTIFGRLGEKVKTWMESTLAGGLLPWIAGHAPNFTPILSFLSDKVTSPVGVKVQTASDAFHFQKAYPKCWDMSYAFPAEHAATAWAQGIDLVNQYAVAGLYPVNLALHGRFTGKSGGWLAPDHDRATGYVEVVTVAHTPHWESFFRELEERWLSNPESRPHWCKVYFQHERIAERYPKLADFLKVRDERDPKGVFLNSFLEKVLFASIRPGARASASAPGLSSEPAPQPGDASKPAPPQTPPLQAPTV